MVTEEVHHCAYCGAPSDGATMRKGKKHFWCVSQENCSRRRVDKTYLNMHDKPILDSFPLLSGPR